MSHFYYQESARKNALQGFAVWLLVVPVLVAILIMFRKTHPSMVIFVGSIVGFVSLFSAFYLYKLFKSDGNWVISINDSELIWRTPNKAGLLGEGSFQCELSQIRKVIGTEAYRFEEIHVDYRLYLENGNTVNLMTNSNVPMDELLKVLQDKGVEYEHRKTQNSS